MVFVASALAQRLVVGTVGSACKAIMAATTRVEVHGHEHLLSALAESARTRQPLIVVMNHTSVLDDPFLLSALLPLRTLWSGRMRWALGASDILFTNGAFSAFFEAGQVLRVERGAGIHQAAMRRAVALLDAGEWLTVFPEGRVVPQSSEAGGLGSFRWGVAHLVNATAQPPIVVPIVHTGMERVSPRKTRILVPGQKVRVAVGGAIQTAPMRGLTLPVITEKLRCAMLSLYPRPTLAE